MSLFYNLLCINVQTPIYELQIKEHKQKSQFKTWLLGWASKQGYWALTYFHISNQNYQEDWKILILWPFLINFLIHIQNQLNLCKLKMILFKKDWTRRTFLFLTVVNYFEFQTWGSNLKWTLIHNPIIWHHHQKRSRHQIRLQFSFKDNKLFGFCALVTVVSSWQIIYSSLPPLQSALKIFAF